MNEDDCKDAKVAVDKFISLCIELKNDGVSRDDILIAMEATIKSQIIFERKRMRQRIEDLGRIYQIALEAGKHELFDTPWHRPKDALDYCMEQPLEWQKSYVERLAYNIESVEAIVNEIRIIAAGFDNLNAQETNDNI